MIKNFSKKIIWLGSALMVLLVPFTFASCGKTETIEEPNPPIVTEVPTPTATETPVATPAPTATPEPVQETNTARAITVDSSKLDLSEDMFIIEIEKPIVTVEGNEEISNIINEAIDIAIDVEVNSIYRAADYNGLTKEKAEETGIKYGLDISYDVFNAENDIVSIKLNSSSFTGTAYPFDTNIAINYNVNKEDPLILADLFIDGYDYESIIRNYIKTAIEDQEKDGPVGYYESYTLGLDFYITNEGINIIFASGEIAPHAVGEVTFKIPYSEIEEGLKPEYK